MYESDDDPISNELGQGEQLLWAGRPRQGLLLRASDAYMIPFSLMWGGFAIFWEATVIAQGAPWFFAIWGVPFVLVGLYIMVGRFWVDAQQRASTFYAVTSDRIVIVSGPFARRVRSLNINTLTDVSLSERGNGSGTITFGPVSWYGRNQCATFGQSAVPSFELAGEARQVYEVIRAAQRATRQLH